MKHIDAAKSSIAWFRLAECLKRKERERAFQLYRLLMHSFDDEAFLKKLEGDMWFEFDLQEALKCYLNAATIYKNRKDYYESYLIVKKMCHFSPENVVYQQLLQEVLIHLPGIDKREKSSL